MADKTCQEPAAYKYTWPDRRDALICEKHSHKLLAVSAALGILVQLTPLSAPTDLCEQIVPKEE
jgi:hypothetical protein